MEAIAELAVATLTPLAKDFAISLIPPELQPFATYGEQLYHMCYGRMRRNGRRKYGFDRTITYAPKLIYTSKLVTNHSFHDIHTVGKMWKISSNVARQNVQIVHC